MANKSRYGEKEGLWKSKQSFVKVDREIGKACKNQNRVLLVLAILSNISKYSGKLMLFPAYKININN